MNGGCMFMDMVLCMVYKVLSKVLGICDVCIVVGRFFCMRSCSGDFENMIGCICVDSIVDGYRDVVDGLIV